MFSCSNDNRKQEFKNTLTKEQQVLYEKIIDERKKIYYGGFLLGIVLSFIAVYFGNKLLFSKYSKSSALPKICMIASITFVTNYLFYILYPKTDYMLLHLNDKTQIQGWLNIYKKMQFKFHLGFILGIVAVIIYSYGFCK
jgi:fructose-specific phosphotransferase system IIC component